MTAMRFPHFVNKSWGIETWFANDEEKGYCGKILEFRKSWRTSLHRHFVKDEVFHVIDGKFLIEYSTHEDAQDLQELRLCPGERFHVPTGMWHRMTALAETERVCRLVEVSTFHSDVDVERLVLSGFVG